MTTEERAVLLGQLKGLREYLPEPSYGICRNVFYNSSILELFHTEGFFKDYPYWSGNPDYPVAHPEEFDPSFGYSTSPAWTGEYGFRRVALLEYIIMKLESL
jgi:hypothetical protein